MDEEVTLSDEERMMNRVQVCPPCTGGGSRCAPQKRDELRLVLLGKTGSGKSALGNTLMGKDDFMVARGMSSGTEKCQHQEACRMDFNLQVTDTPGVCDTHREEQEVLKEVGKSLAVASPGPHVILMVLRCDRRFTQEEYDAYVTLKTLFGDTICDHMVLVFSGIDCFGDTTRKQEDGLHEAVNNSPEHLKKVLFDAKGRYCGVNNTAPRDQRERMAAVVMTHVKDVMKVNENRHLSSKLITDVDKHVETLISKGMKENNQSYCEAKKKARKDIVEDKAGAGFFRGLIDTIGNAVIPVLKFVVGSLQRGAAAAACSVM